MREFEISVPCPTNDLGMTPRVDARSSARSEVDVIRVMGLRIERVRWWRVAAALALLAGVAPGCCSFLDEELEQVQAQDRQLEDVRARNRHLEARQVELEALLDTAAQRRAAAQGGHSRLSELVAALEDDLAALRREHADTRKRLREKQLLLSMCEDPPGGFSVLPPGPPVPAIDAEVLAVKHEVEPNLVLLSAGSDEEVEQGYRFSVYRGSDFIGKVVVERVLSDSSGCRVLFTAEGRSIKPGDLAATRLQ